MQPAIIHLEKNEELKGLEHLDTLYQSILKKVALRIDYQSFSARQANVILFHPYILKEFNNRWFLIGRREGEIKIMTLALDRIHSIQYDLSVAYDQDNFDADKYYEHTYGVTVLGEDHVMEIELKFNRSNAPYVLTKPLHHSQKIIEQHEDGSVTICVHLHLNYELERLILGFGESVQVLKPKNLRRRIKSKLKKALESYNQSN